MPVSSGQHIKHNKKRKKKSGEKREREGGGEASRQKNKGRNEDCEGAKGDMLALNRTYHAMKY
jgi:hypothetical protein